MNDSNTSVTDTYKVKFKTICGEKYWVPVDVSYTLEKERNQFKEMFDMQTKLVVDLEMRLIKMEEQLKNYDNN